MTTTYFKRYKHNRTIAHQTQDCLCKTYPGQHTGHLASSQQVQLSLASTSSLRHHVEFKSNQTTPDYARVMIFKNSALRAHHDERLLEIEDPFAFTRAVIVVVVLVLLIAFGSWYCCCRTGCQKNEVLISPGDITPAPDTEQRTSPEFK